MDLEQKIVEVAPSFNKEVISLISEQIKANTNLIYKAFGVCVTGFFVLAGWMWYMIGRINEHQNLSTEMKELKEVLKEIRDAFIGDFDKKGLITKHYDLEARVKSLEEKDGR